MSSVDDRVVGMKFNNSTFERGVRTTLGTLGKLKSSLDFSKNTKSLNDLEASASKFNMGHMGASVEGVSKKFLALGAVAITAIANITNRVVDAGLQLAKSLTIQPIIDGFHEYETQLGSIQTILANTGLEGAKGLAEVNGALKQLNKYADQTIYNFGEMVRNIGTFTAAGIKLQPATEAIKGIANLAALSGSTADQASTAMYQLSQAIAANKVGLQDWNSVVNAGMGGKVFQEALFNTAKQMKTIKGVGMGTTFDQWTDAGNSFRLSLEKGWITGDVLTQTLRQFTGDLTDAQLKQLGYTDKQVAAIQKQAKTASDAATKVKTLTQLMDTLREAVGSGWSATFAIIFGNFNEAKELFTNVSNVLGGFISQSSNARNKVLKDWKALGGRTLLIEGIANAFHSLISILKPIKDAFRDIFPAKTGQDLYDLTVRFSNFMKSLEIGSDTAENLRRTFRGVFAIFDIIGQVIGGVIHLFGTLFSTISGGSGGILDITGNMGDFLVSVDEALKKGNRLTNFFDGLGKILAVPIALLKVVTTYISNLFSGFDTGAADKATNASSRLAQAGEFLADAWGRVVDFFRSMAPSLKPILDGIGNLFDSIGQALQDTFGSANFDSIIKTFNTALLGGILLALRKFLSGGINVDVGGGLFGSIKESFEGLTGTLTAMQTQLKAKALLEIGAAVALIAASLVALSTIKPKKLDSALKGLTVAFGELIGAMALLTKATVGAGIVKLPAMAAAMDLLAGAVLVLVLAVKSLSKLDPAALSQGLKGLGAILAEITGAAVILAKSGGSLAGTSLALIAFATAVRILVGAVRAFGEMDSGKLTKGLIGIAGALIVLAGAMRLMPPGMAAEGVGLAIVAGSLQLIAMAISKFASFDMKEMVKGLGGIAAALVVIAGAMKIMPPTMIAQGAGLILVGAALQLIAKAVSSMASLSWKELAKGLVGMAGAMLILAVAMNAMQGSIGGSVAMAVASASLLLIAHALKVLGSMSPTEIVKALLAMAGAFLVLGVAGAALAPLAPALAAAGAALFLFSAAVALAGAGVYLLGKGIGYLAEHGAQGIAILLKAIDAFIVRLPKILSSLATGLVQFILIIGKNAPAMVKAFGQILEALMQAIIDVLPKALELFSKLIGTLLVAISKNLPKIVDAGLKLIVKLLEGVAKALPDILEAAADVVVAFLEGLGDQLPRIVQAGFDMVIKFLDGLADAIRKNEPRIIAALARVGAAVVLGLWDGMKSLAGWIWGKVKGFFSSLWDKVKGWFGIHSPSRRAMEIGAAIVKGIWEGIKNFTGWIWSKIKGFFSSLWSKIKGFFGIAGAISGLAVKLGVAVVKGVWSGISSLASWLKDKVTSFFGSLWDKIKSIFGFAGGLALLPFKLGIGIVKGLWGGISSLASWLRSKVTDFFGGILDKIKGIFGFAGGIAGKIVGTGAGIVKGIWSGIRGVGSGIRTKIFDFFSSMMDHIESLLSASFSFGVHLVSGLVDGFQSAIGEAKDTIVGGVSDVIGGIGGALGIGSPSRITRWFSEMMVAGLVLGFIENKRKAEVAAENLSDGMLDSLKKNLDKTPDLGIPTNPTIRPVLDLSSVQKDAAKIGGLFSGAKVTTDVAVNTARAISASSNARNPATPPGVAVSAAAKEIKLEQNNYSPKNLSAIDIYRQTKNLLALAKEAST